MKRINHKAWRVLLSSLLISAMVRLSGAITAFAAEPIEADSVAAWKASEDDTVLSNGEMTYELYVGSMDISPDPSVRYEYDSTVSLTCEPEGEEYGGCTVHAATLDDPHIVWVEGWNDTYVYVTDEGRAALDAFCAGEGVTYRLSGGRHFYADVDESVIKTADDALAAGKETRTEDVRGLKNAWLYDVVVYDESDSFSYKYGAVYELDGTYYYICYVTLGNEYFDADGNFSYRRGNVTLTRLDDEAKQLVDEAAGRIEERETDYRYEADSAFEFTGSDMPIAVFWICYALIGFVVPLALLALGVILANSKRLGRAKYWYGTSVLALLWIVLAIILMIVLLL
jgi:hypothetical protein